VLQGGEGAAAAILGFKTGVQVPRPSGGRSGAGASAVMALAASPTGSGARINPSLPRPLSHPTLPAALFTGRFLGAAGEAISLAAQLETCQKALVSKGN